MNLDKAYEAYVLARGGNALDYALESDGLGGFKIANIWINDSEIAPIWNVAKLGAVPGAPELAPYLALSITSDKSSIVANGIEVATVTVTGASGAVIKYKLKRNGLTVKTGQKPIVSGGATFTYLTDTPGIYRLEIQVDNTLIGGFIEIEAV